MMFNKDLAEAMQRYALRMRSSPALVQAFKSDPTGEVIKALQAESVAIPEPADEFHAHAIQSGDELPEEPERATRDRYIYIFRESGLFEFKSVPGSSTGSDDFMRTPKGACQCCNCCVIVV